MRTKLVSVVVGSMLAFSAHAATWNVIKTIGGERSVFFFDADSLVKRSNGVTIWIKSVQADDAPDKDGSYATAMKYNIDCNKRTLQALTMVTYDKTQAPIHTIRKALDPAEAVPGSIGESLVQMTCAKIFPNKQAVDYTAVPGNDIFTFTKAFFDIKNDPAPK